MTTELEADGGDELVLARGADHAAPSAESVAGGSSSSMEPGGGSLGR
jgi:hypothetical protein